MFLLFYKADFEIILCLFGFAIFMVEESIFERFLTCVLGVLGCEQGQFCVFKQKSFSIMLKGQNQLVFDICSRLFFKFWRILRVQYFIIDSGSPIGPLDTDRLLAVLQPFFGLILQFFHLCLFLTFAQFLSFFKYLFYPHLNIKF